MARYTLFAGNIDNQDEFNNDELRGEAFAEIVRIITERVGEGRITSRLNALAILGVTLDPQELEMIERDFEERFGRSLQWTDKSGEPMLCGAASCAE